MLSWLAKRMIARNMAKASEGDLGPTLRMDADDVRFRFPGNSSWSGEITGKAYLEPWLRRFAEVGIQIYPDEVVLKGFPWKQTICIRGRDHLDSPEGERVYENRYVIWGHISWGLLRDYEVYEDTQKARVLDEYLASQGDELSQRTVGSGA
jgi:ketosteroid isomerase-like protein